MAFDWITFLDRQNIDYVSAGSDNVECPCPWCGAEEHGRHMSISLSGKGYKCWLRPLEHRGKSVPKLIQALLGCSWGEAFSLAGVESRGPSLAEMEFMAKARELLGGEKRVTPVEELRYLKEFRPLVPEGSGRYFVEHMVSERGYEIDELYDLQRWYQLQCAISGYFKYRIIIPIYMNDNLVTWTGRSIKRNADIRYLTLSAKPTKAELPLAPMSIDKTLWNYDALKKGGEDLYICEGPFDALRIDYVGHSRGIRATCVFKKQISASQVTLLDNISHLFRRIYLLFDAGEHLDILRTRSQLAHLKLRSRTLPAGYKDAGEMGYKAASRFLGL
jgi:hypothetical protein